MTDLGNVSFPSFALALFFAKSVCVCVCMWAFEEGNLFSSCTEFFGQQQKYDYVDQEKRMMMMRMKNGERICAGLFSKSKLILQIYGTTDVSHSRFSSGWAKDGSEL